MTLDVWISLTDERWVPINYVGTVLYDRESGTQSFASPTAAGRRKFQAQFRAMSFKARALGYRNTALMIKAV